MAQRNEQPWILARQPVNFAVRLVAWKGFTVSSTHSRSVTGRDALPRWAWSEHVLLWAVSLTTFAIGIDTTVIGVALPTIHRELPVSGWGISAVVVGYTLTFGSLMLSAGHLADIVGRRRVFVCGA
jgi:Major Facilitator Superfamily